MAFLFCGHKAKQFKPTTGYFSDSTTAGNFDSNYTDSAVQVPDRTNAGGGGTVSFGDGTETDIWVHMLVKNFNGTTNEDGAAFILYGDLGHQIAAIWLGPSTNQARMVDYTAGTNAVQRGSTFSVGSTLVPIDFHVQYDNGGSGNIVMDFYYNGVAMGGGTQTNAITTNNSTGIAALKIGGYDVGSWLFSELIVANQDTRGMRLGQMTPDGAGNYSAWDGAGTDIGFNKERVGIETDTAADRESWSLSAYSGPASPTTIHAVVNQVYCTPGNSGPSQIDSFFRISSTDYDAGAVTAEPLKPNVYEWTTNPSTAAAWATTDFGALEAGVEAVT